MARNTIPKGKLVRRFEENIFGNPKYDKLLKKKPNAPGRPANERRRRKVSDYGKSLNEKQKFKYSYGLSERQLKAIYKKAAKSDGDTGLNLITLTERRLDNVVLRANFSTTTPQARQLVSHGHLLVNGRKMKIPSYVVKIDDVITVKDRDDSKKLVKSYLELNEHRLSAEWVEVDEDKLTVKLLRQPDRVEARFTGQEQMIVEYYSR